MEQKGTSRLDDLKARRVRLDALIQCASAREAARSRKLVLRRRIVAGTIFLERLYPHDENVRRWFESQLKRPEDRRLFGLDPSVKNGPL